MIKLIMTTEDCESCVEYERLLDDYRAILSSGLCSEHRMPMPLICDACNKVKVLEQTVENYRNRAAGLEQEISRLEGLLLSRCTKE